jgi:hypothetical protein
MERNLLAAVGDGDELRQRQRRAVKVRHGCAAIAELPGRILHR